MSANKELENDEFPMPELYYIQLQKSFTSASNECIHQKWNDPLKVVHRQISKPCVQLDA